MVACSGGRDSLSLARALHLLLPNQVRVLHVNHQLQQPAIEWEMWLSDQCKQWGLPCQVERVQVKVGNIEEQARKARYQVLFAALQPYEILVLGHHQQDQAETLFLRLMSGSGVVGLSAMKMLEARQWHQPDQQKLDDRQKQSQQEQNQQEQPKKIQLWRPLLECSREQITQLAQLICPSYIDDPANELDNFDRVFLRQQVWPLLKSRWPSMDNSISRTTLLMQDTSEILQEVVQLDWQRCIDQNGVVDLSELSQLSIARQRLLISRWMQGQEQYAPAFHIVEQIRQQLIDAQQDANPKILWQKWQFRRYRQQLYRLPKQLLIATDLQADWPLEQLFKLPSGEWQWQQQPFGLPLELVQQNWQLKPRQGGEMLHLKGRVGHWLLKKSLQEARLAPWQREQVHVLMQKDIIYGVLTAQGFWPTEQTAWVASGWLPVLKA